MNKIKSISKWHRCLLFISNVLMIFLVYLITESNDSLNISMFSVFVMMPIVLLLLICIAELYLSDKPFNSKEKKSICLITIMIMSTISFILNPFSLSQKLYFTIVSTLIVFLNSIYIYSNNKKKES